jgi:hypothetical protein
MVDPGETEVCTHMRQSDVAVHSAHTTHARLKSSERVNLNVCARYIYDRTLVQSSLPWRAQPFSCHGERNGLGWQLSPSGTAALPAKQMESVVPASAVDRAVKAPPPATRTKSRANPAVRVHVGRRSPWGWALLSCSGVECFGAPLICIAELQRGCRRAAQLGYVRLVPHARRSVVRSILRQT